MRAQSDTNIWIKVPHQWIIVFRACRWCWPFGLEGRGGRPIFWGSGGGCWFIHGGGRVGWKSFRRRVVVAVCLYPHPRLVKMTILYTILRKSNKIRNIFRRMWMTDEVIFYSSSLGFSFSDKPNYLARRWSSQVVLPSSSVASHDFDPQLYWEAHHQPRNWWVFTVTSRKDLLRGIVALAFFRVFGCSLLFIIIIPLSFS